VAAGLSSGHPSPVTLEDVEGCFNNLTGVVATESATLVELVKANVALPASNVTLIASKVLHGNTQNYNNTLIFF
jgi:hypothetical protein